MANQNKAVTTTSAVQSNEMHASALIKAQAATQAQAQATAQATAASAVREVKSAKAWLIELFTTGASYTLAELIALTGKTEINLRTQLGDLKNARYAGAYGVQPIVSTRTNVNGKNVTRYSFKAQSAQQ